MTKAYKMAIVSYTMEQVKKIKSQPGWKSQTDWERLRNMRDEDIVYDEDSPKLTDAELKQFRRAVGRPKQDTVLQPIYMRLDKETVDHLRSDGPGWQKRFREKLNRAIRLGVL